MRGVFRHTRTSKTSEESRVDAWVYGLAGDMACFEVDFAGKKEWWLKDWNLLSNGGFGARLVFDGTFVKSRRSQRVVVV